MTRLLALVCFATILLLTACSIERPGPEPTPEPTPGLISSLASNCTSADYREPTRHRRGLPPRTTAEALKRRFCSLEVSVSGGMSHELEWQATSFRFWLQRAPLHQFPYVVDSNSPALWHEDLLHVFNSGWEQTYRSNGPDIENLAEPQAVELPKPGRPGTVWMEALWKDPSDSTVYGWYHFEPSDLACLTAPFIGAAVSYDQGLTWEDRGPVIENGYPIDCSFGNGYFAGGSGDFSVIPGPRGQNLYFLFSNYAGPLEEQGVAVARSALTARGQPGTVFKYYKGAWSEPGLKGRASALFRSSTGWKGPHVEAFWGPSVHWNTYLGMYTSLMNHTEGENWAQEGIYITFSHDLLNWTTPEKILESNDWYPQVVGLGDGGTDSHADQTMRLYVGGVSRLILRFEVSSSLIGGPSTHEINIPRQADSLDPMSLRRKPPSGE
jgi:hypothetical protein